MTDDEKRANPRCIGCGARRPSAEFVNATGRARRHCRACAPGIARMLDERDRKAGRSPGVRGAAK